ncbi:hypothetical protein GCM10027289_28020 [Tsukamurella serpentis]
MNTQKTRLLGAALAAVALTVSLTACGEAKDAASNATAAAGSAAGKATEAAGSAASKITGAPGSGAAAESGSAGSGAAGSESKAAVPSTTISTPGGKEVTLTDAPIIAEYAKYGYEKGHLGAPMGPVSPLPDGKGKYLTLKGGTIYWSQGSGAHIVHGVIGEKWGAAGHESGKLGYPTSDETSENGAIKQTFQNGTITFRDGVATVS